MYHFLKLNGISRFLFGIVMLTGSTIFAQSGIYESYAVVNLNGAGNTYYDLQATTGNPDFQGAYLGSFEIGQSLVLAGGENKTYKCFPCDITNGKIWYRVWSGTPSGSFTAINLPFDSNLGTGCGGNDQKWASTANVSNLLTGLTAGNYTLEIYSTADFAGCDAGTHYASNGGANYQATFTVTCPTITVLATPIDATCAGGANNGSISLAVSGGTPFVDVSTQTNTENFNTLATTGTSNTWTDNTTLPSWYSNRIIYIASTGTSTTGGLYSYGATGSNERTIGSVASGGTGSIFYGIKIVNILSETVTSVSVSYTGEQWRNGGNTTAHKLDFTYAKNPTSITSGTYVDVNALDFTGPIATATSAALDGNLAANRVSLSNTITISLLPGEEIWLRWQDVDDSGNDHGLGVDDLSVILNAPTSYYNYTWSNGDVNQNISGLVADNYNVTVTDANGCTGNTSATVNLTGESTFYLDSDGDGYGNNAMSEIACSASSGFVADNTDCDDDNAAINPGATEICNGLDDDCSGGFDDGLTFLDYYVDADGDGYGQGAAFGFCEAPGGSWVLLTGDCDDDNAAINPGATEICNGLDDDCVGGFDDGLTFLDYYADLDADGYGDGAAFGFCEAPGGTYVLLTGDCDDDNAAINPGATEICNGLDDDCVGGVDDGLIFLDYYADLDADGYGDGAAFGFCEAPGGTYVLLNGDCDDDNAAINPGATEICNGLDDDCSGGFDDGLTFLDYYVDADGDGYGQGAAFGFCEAPGGSWVLLTGDCDDDNAAINPGATEICNGLDDDCVGGFDDGLTFLDYYADLDADGYGDGAAFGFCEAPGGTYVLLNGDCDDDNAAINPGATEICNGLDDDCVGGVDDGLIFTIYYADVDMDTYGDAGSTISTCDGAPSGYVSDNTDCDDANNTVYPGAVELCDGLDNNCNGDYDEGTVTATITPAGNTETCKGEAATLSANTGMGYTYQWFKNGNIIPGATNPTYDATKPANYQVQVNTPEGCFELSAATFVGVLPNPNANISAPNGTSLCGSVKLKASYDATYSWQWNESGSPIGGATNYLFFPTTPGAYSCTVYSANGCSRTSPIINVTACKAGDVNEAVATESFEMYPNPTNSEFVIELSLFTNAESATVQLFNIMGESVYENNVPVNNGNINESIQLNDAIPAGMYIVKVTVDGSEHAKQLILQK